MDNFIRQFTASQIRGAAIGNAVCNPLVSFLTNLRGQNLTLERAVTDGVVTAVGDGAVAVHFAEEYLALNQ